MIIKKSINLQRNDLREWGRQRTAKCRANKMAPEAADAPQAEGEEPIPPAVTVTRSARITNQPPP